MSRRGVLLGALCLGAAPAAAQAPDWPDRPVRLIVAFAPGGPTDLVARILGERLTQLWPQPAVVENRGGAGGNIAAQAVARSRPDGLTVLVTTSAFAVNPSLSRRAGYRVEEFAVAAIPAATPNVLVVRPDFEARTLAELIALGRRQPLNYGTAGVGTTPHLSAERLLRLLAGIDPQHVPFAGAAPALTAVLGGQLDLASVALPAATEMLRAGVLRGLAITASHRVAAVPDVPTAAESGFAGVDDATWVGVLVPAGVPEPVLRRLNGDIATVMADGGVQARLAAAGFEPVGGSLEEAARFVAAEVARWGEVVRAIGASLD